MADNPVRASAAGVLLFAIGVAIGGGAIMNYERERQRLLAWNRADGEVVQLLQVSGGRARPIVSFATAGGDRIRFTAMGRTADRNYQLGERVPVIYPIGDPAAARIDSPALRWGRSLYAGIGAVVIMVLGGYIAWYARRRVGG